MKKEIGDLGEQFVSRWLQLNNYQILQHNWHCPWGEIDLIAQDKISQAIAFVEVKTRNGRNWDADGLLAVNPSKQQKLLKTASLFLGKHPNLAELPCRFDVGLVSYQSGVQIKTATVELDEISQIKIGQPVRVGHYQLILKDYLQNAFD